MWYDTNTASSTVEPTAEGRVEIVLRSFVVDENGRKTAVVLPIREYERLLEDLEALAVIAQRRNEPTESLATVVKRLEGKKPMRFENLTDEVGMNEHGTVPANHARS